MDTQTLILIVIGVVLLIALVLLSSVAMGGMVMMAGMMATPVGWVVLLIILAVAALVGYLAFYA